jgi:hypothetical protein
VHPAGGVPYPALLVQLGVHDRVHGDRRIGAVRPLNRTRCDVASAQSLA